MDIDTTVSSKSRLSYRWYFIHLCKNSFQKCLALHQSPHGIGLSDRACRCMVVRSPMPTLPAASVPKRGIVEAKAIRRAAMAKWHTSPRHNNVLMRLTNHGTIEPHPTLSYANTIVEFKNQKSTEHMIHKHTEITNTQTPTMQQVMMKSMSTCNDEIMCSVFFQYQSRGSHIICCPSAVIQWPAVIFPECFTTS